MIKGLEIGEPAAVQSGRMSGDERRSQILRVAIRLFSRHGFSGTTTKEIALSAGVSEAMVFRHFATKEELYDAILDYKACHGGMQQMLWEENSLIKRAIDKNDDFAFFYNLALNTLNNHQADTDFIRLLFHSALEEHQLAEKFFDQFIARIYEFISAYVKRRQREGAMRKIDPTVVVRSFLGMITNHSLNNTLWDKSRRILNISNEEAARAFAEILLRGILREKQR